MGTIFALASARGKSGVAVIRISGSDAFEVADQVISGSIPKPGEHRLRRIVGRDGGVIDQGLVLAFTGPHSFTGENVIELQVHGSLAIIRAVEEAIRGTGLARLAEAGEFTQRALLNGTLDLTQVEGLRDLIEAETEAQRLQASKVFSGSFSEKVAEWRRDLVRAMALIEALIDFAEEDVPYDTSPEVSALLVKVGAGLQDEIAGTYVAERLRDGFEVAIVGAPNAGKSTLLNALAGRDIALTSEIAGTTRDVLEARLDVHGIPVTFLDTAGLRVTDDPTEGLGIDRGLERALEADLRVLLETDDWICPSELEGRIDVALVAKADKGTKNGISGRTGAGVDTLLSMIGDAFSDQISVVRLAISDRQRGGMQRAAAFLNEAQHAMDAGVGSEVVAESLRSAVLALDSLIGRVDVEAVLGEIFQSFCIGK